MSGKSNDEIASWFITSTCQLIPKSFSGVYDYMHHMAMTSSPETKRYSFLSGSSAEFYIRPLNTCIGDYDLLVCNTYELAFSGDIAVLPRDISGIADTILCYKIESYQKYPGFVKLRFLGLMNYNWKYKMYQFIDTSLSGLHIGLSINLDSLISSRSGEFCLALSGSTSPSVVSGPAIRTQTDSNLLLGRDEVRSVFCPQWPTDAKHWPNRPRKYGWPTNDTIFEVVQSGCHVVYVQHRSCRDVKTQWRLSFSMAELILLQSLTQIQQIVYHLLRFFAKKVLLQDDCPKEDEVLCTYHLKTLMLWTCEEMSPEWWNSSSVIAICCELLQNLSEWLKRRYCPNYFIPEANLFREPLSLAMLDKTERRLNECHNCRILCQWFVENYILPITRTQLTFFNTRKVAPDFMDYMLPLIDYRKASEMESLDILLYFRSSDYNKMFRCIIKYGLSSELRQNLKLGQYTRNLTSKVHSKMTYLPTTEKVLCFKYYDFLLYILHVAYGLCNEEISRDSSLFAEFFQAISMQNKTVRSQYHNFPKMYTKQGQSGWFQYMGAQDLMQNLTGSNSRSESQLLSLMSIEFLREALECKDSQFNGIAPAALAYLAAVHFATSEYQQAIRFCLLIVMHQTSQKNTEILNAGCLLFIDDVARIVGLRVLHMKITENNLHYIGRRLYLDLRLSPKVFAYYLAIFAAERISKRSDFDHDLPESEFPMDEILMSLRKPKCIAATKLSAHFKTAREIVYRRRDSLTEIETKYINPLKCKETVIGILMEIALENMTLFYRVIRKDFGIQCNTIDCYRALYLYKCRQYNEVLLLCEQILIEPDLQSDLKEFAFVNISVLPPLDSFFDGDIQSLLGFHKILYHLSPLNNNYKLKFMVTDESIFAQWVVKNAYSHNNKLSSFLHDYYFIKCNNFLGRHFLARYLKVRCFLDCNLPYSEALTEFSAYKTNFPFEHIIRRFLSKKLRVIKI